MEILVLLIDERKIKVEFKNSSYGINDLRDLYTKYVFPTIKSKSKPDSYIIRQVKKICSFCDISYDESNIEFILDYESLQQIERILKNRKMYYDNQLSLYSTKQVSEILNCNESHVTTLYKRKIIEFSTTMNGQAYYYCDEIDNIKKMLDTTYSAEYIYDEVRNNLHGVSILSSTIRDYMLKNNLAISNPVDRYDLRIKKEDLDFLIKEIDRNFISRKIKDTDNLISEFDKLIKDKSLNYISGNEENYYDYYYLNSLYISDGKIKKKSAKLNRQIIRKMISSCNSLGIKWYTNSSLDNFYIKKEDYKKLQTEIHEMNGINSEDYYTTNEVCELLEVSSYTSILDYAGYKKKDGLLLINRDKVDEIYKLKKETIRITTLANEIGVLDRRIRHVIEKLDIKILRFDGIPIVNGDRVSINNSLKIKEIFEKERRINEATNILDKFYITVEGEPKNELIPKTYEVFEKFLISRFNSNRGKVVFRALLFCYKNILLNLKKEIFNCNDNDILNIFSYDYDHQEAVKQFLFFLEFCQVNYNVNYKNQHTLKPSSYNSAERYSKEVWIGFAELMFNSKSNEYFELLKHAINERMAASTWLFCAMHYVCAWRAQDIIKKLPKINLELVINLNELELIEVIRRQEFTKSMAQRVVNEVIKYIKYLEVTPSKKESYSLSLSISESYVYTIGLLVCLCEAHRRLAEKSNKRLNTSCLIPEGATRKENHVKFFGEKYNEIFRGEYFTNNRATKTYLSMIQIISQKKGWGDGYHLAALQRSHTLNKGEIANTTQLYLKSINRDGDVDKIMYALAERGAFGYVLHQLMKIVAPKQVEYSELDMIEQNELINELIPFKPNEVETILKSFSNYRSTIDNLITELVNQDKIDFKSIMIKLALGMVPSKMKYSHCLLKTIIKEGCIYPLRNECLGCKYLVPEIYFLLEFNNHLFNLLDKIEECEYLFDKRRYSFMLTEKYLPILEDAISYFGKERVEAFINIQELRSSMIKLYQDSKLLVR